MSQSERDLIINWHKQRHHIAGDLVANALEARLDAEVGEGDFDKLLLDLSTHPPTITRDVCINAIRQLLRERDEARKENEALAAWQCPFQDGEKGLTSDERGNQYCMMEARVKELESKLQGRILPCGRGA